MLDRQDIFGRSDEETLRGHTRETTPRTQGTTLGGAPAAGHVPAPPALRKEVNLEDRALAVANERLAVLERFWSGLEKGLSQDEAAKPTGTSKSTLLRWDRAYRKKGFRGLAPSTANCGRKSTAEKLNLTPDDEHIQRIRGLVLDMGSEVMALRWYARQEECPAELRQVIIEHGNRSKHSVPPSLRKLIRVNAPLALKHRGPRALGLHGAWTPRAMDILPGDIFTSDDTTPIWAWWVPWRQDKDYPFGVKVLQGQLLPVVDVASMKVITFALIAREGSSYRAADIWGLFGQAFDLVGLPRLGMHLERGSWEANLIRGQVVESSDDEPREARRVGGLRMLPTNITEWHQATLGEKFPFPQTLQTWTSYLPKNKYVEGFFNRSQVLESTLFGALGRDQRRVPNERAVKTYEACKRGAMDPRLHFLSAEEMAARLSELMNFLNHEPMEGEVFRGVPEDRWNTWVEKYPLYRMPEESRWLYQRHWRLVQVRQGKVRIKLTHRDTGENRAVYYTNPRQFAGLEEQQVLVYFDEAKPEAPAQIVDPATGQYICTAEHEERVGAFFGHDEEAHARRAAWRQQVSTTYAEIGSKAPSRQVPPEIQERRNAAGGTLVGRQPAGVWSEATRPAAPSRELKPTSDHQAKIRAILAAQGKALMEEMD